MLKSVVCVGYLDLPALSTFKQLHARTDIQIPFPKLTAFINEDGDIHHRSKLWGHSENHIELFWEQLDRIQLIQLLEEAHGKISLD